MARQQQLNGGRQKTDDPGVLEMQAKQKKS